nr:DNA/RNA non-specific endonuclease [Pirellula staleyi]
MALRKLQNGDFDDVSPRERMHLEAIVEEDGRPVVFVIDDQFDTLPEPWTQFNAAPVRSRINALIPSIGRIEDISGGIPQHIGTGFIVGPNLMMTNRHVAEAFVRGVGRFRDQLSFVPGIESAIDFRRESGLDPSDLSTSLHLTDVVMVHPYWDMAIFRVEGLSAAHKALQLSVRAPEDLVGRNIVAIGYPGRGNDRSRRAVQLERKVFGTTFGVKRLAPGEIEVRERVESFDYVVPAMTHDSSTLAGNSGSAIIDVETGEVVGLHFAGITLKANYSVPLFELARDPRVVDSGINFVGSVPPTDEWDRAWRGVESLGGGAVSAPIPSTPFVSGTGSSQTGTWTIPIQVSISIGQPLSIATVAPATAPVHAAREATFQVPVIHPNLEQRTGYDPNFLELDGGELVPMPELTSDGRDITSVLADGSHELKYHKFSVVMHKQRRLALFSAANVSWQSADKMLSNGHKPTRKELNGFDNDYTIESWATDDRIPLEEQLHDKFLINDQGAFDRGHLVRRDDVAWGDSFLDMQKGNGDTFHTTNCSPQVAKFNQASKGVDNWGDLENLIEDETTAERVIVFAGPVLDPSDKRFNGVDSSGPLKIQIPRQFWKIVIAKTEDGPKAFGFVLKQKLTGVPLEFAVPEDWEPYQVSIQEIEDLLFGLATLDWCKSHDAFANEGSRVVAIREHLSGLGGLTSTQGTLRDVVLNPQPIPHESEPVPGNPPVQVSFPSTVAPETPLEASAGSTATWTIPLTVSVTIGSPLQNDLKTCSSELVPLNRNLPKPTEAKSKPARTVVSPELTTVKHDTYLDHIGAFESKAALRRQENMIQVQESCLTTTLKSAEPERGSPTVNDPVFPMLVKVRSIEDWTCPIGFIERSVIGTIITGSGTAASLSSLNQDQNVLSIEASRPAGILEWSSSSYVGAPAVHSSPAGETGCHCICGIIDTGIDILHKAFLTSDGTGESRVLEIWDQRAEYGRTPAQEFPNLASLNYGTVFSMERIRSFVREGRVPAKLGRDDLGHGTHVSSIAAGKAEGDYLGGVAPDAKIVLVIPKLSVMSSDPYSLGYSASHVEALAYLKSRAASFGLPLVVNVSLGMNAGAHDGSSLLEAAFDAYTNGGTAPGLAIVKSAGNERAAGGHALIQIANGRTDLLEWLSDPEIHRPEDYLELWFNSSDICEFVLFSPTGQESRIVSRYSPRQVLTCEDGTKSIIDLSYRHHDNGDSRLQITVRPNRYGRIAGGEWKLKVRGIDVKSEGWIHAWFERSGVRPTRFLNNISQSYTLSIPGTARSVITVGGIDENGQNEPSSSFGPLRLDDAANPKPDLVAPGASIEAAKAGTFSKCISMSGTSTAAPHVTGAIALVFSFHRKNGTSMPNAIQVKKALWQTTKHYNGRHNNSFGYGILDIERFFEAMK